MTPFEAAALGAVQGLTEFLPISSSAHLYLIPKLLDWQYGGVAFDVALHWGTLVALVGAFWRDWTDLARGAFTRDPRRRSAARQTWLKLAVASVPAGVAGWLLKDAAESSMRWIPLQAATLFVFGFLLWWVDRMSPARRDERAWGWGTCLFVGAAQAVALVPGVSRSGVTMTAGRAAGLDRVAAARFSFLLAAPITLGAGLVELRGWSGAVPLHTLAIGVLCAAGFGLLSIRFLLRWLAHAGFGWFFAYRAAVAVCIILWSQR